LDGLCLGDLPAPGSGEAAEQAFAEIRAHGVCDPFQCEYLTAAGARIPVLVGGALLEEGNGLVFALDISERNRLEEKLRQTAKLESLGILAGGIAHDFNNLLTGILGNSTLALDQTPPGSSIAELLRTVIQACERAAALANQILAYSGRGKFRLEHVNLPALVSETLTLIETALGRAVSLQLDIASDVPFVEGDSSQLQQVVMNLAINAAEAVDNKGEVSVRTGTLELDGKRHPNDIVPGPSALAGRYVFLEVRDSGPGMDQDTLQRIFDPFFTTKSAGRGLGLAAVLGIVRNHKGVIRVASAAGGGTTFSVYLPVSRRQPSENAPYLAHHLSRGGMVLVIDDEIYVRETVRRSLEAAGYTVICAADSAEAVQLFQSLGSQIELAIVDMTLPGEEGQEIVRRLRHYDPKLKVIATSGYAEAEVKEKFGDLMDGFLAKPYRSDHLCQAVAAVLAA
jgi:signal transduction histidine kinase/CheY-like chemotaxis protein